MPRAPLPITSVTHEGVVSSTTSKGVTPSSSLLRAHAPNPFPHTYLPRSVQVAANPCWKTGSSRRYLCKCFSGCLSHGSRRVAGCACLFLPRHRRPSPSPAPGSASPNRPAKRLRAAGVSSPSLFLTFRPPGLLATQVSPTAAPKRPQGSRDFSTRANHTSYRCVHRVC